MNHFYYNYSYLILTSKKKRFFVLSDKIIILIYVVSIHSIFSSNINDFSILLLLARNNTRNLC